PGFLPGHPATGRPPGRRAAADRAGRHGVRAALRHARGPPRRARVPRVLRPAPPRPGGAARPPPRRRRLPCRRRQRLPLMSSVSIVVTGDSPAAAEVHSLVTAWTRAGITEPSLWVRGSQVISTDGS